MSNNQVSEPVLLRLGMLYLAKSGLISRRALMAWASIASSGTS